jgi:uncharacterized protein (TIGR03086 family)
MNLHPQLTEAADAAARVVSGVSPDQLDGPTPCPDWDVRALVNHLILWTSYSLERRAHGESVADELMSADFAAAADFAVRYREQLDRALAAWADPAAWERKLDVMGTPMEAADVAAMNLMDMVLHAWDLAVATGQAYALPDDTAQVVARAVEANAELFRQYQGFAEPVVVPPGASALDQALAGSGRDPRWARDRGWAR